VGELHHLRRNASSPMSQPISAYLREVQNTRREVTNLANALRTDSRLYHGFYTELRGVLASLEHRIEALEKRVQGE